MRLVWEDVALADLAAAADWSVLQARAVVEAMERMADRGFSLGKPTGRPGVRYWPVPPLGVLYTVVGDELRVLQVLDVRQLLDTPPSSRAAARPFESKNSAHRSTAAALAMPGETIATVERLADEVGAFGAAASAA